jgi:hypothetical protein
MIRGSAFSDVSIDSHKLRIKLTKVEDRRRFLFGRPGSETSGHNEALSSFLEFLGCGRDCTVEFSFVYVRICEFMD